MFSVPITFPPVNHKLLQNSQNALDRQKKLVYYIDQIQKMDIVKQDTELKKRKNGQELRYSGFC